MIGFILSGLLGTMNMILWGVYGDLMVEKFEVKKIHRSLFFGVFYSLFFYLIDPSMPLFIVALVVIAMERLSTEIYKAFLREEDQKKYQIPSDLKLPLKSHVKKALGSILLIFSLLFVYHSHSWKWPYLSFYSIGVVGLVTAIGGMFKDAPSEGFKLITFFRSPINAILIGLFVLHLFPDIPFFFLVLAISGGERILSEFYKKILLGRVPGKFRRDLIVNSNWQSQRTLLLPVYCLNVGTLFLLLFKKSLI